MKVLVIDDDPNEWEDRSEGIFSELPEYIFCKLFNSIATETETKNHEGIQRVYEFFETEVSYEKRVLLCTITPDIFDTILERKLKWQEIVDLVMFDVSLSGDKQNDIEGLFKAKDFIDKTNFDYRKIIAVTNKTFEEHFEHGYNNLFPLPGSNNNISIHAYSKEAAPKIALFLTDIMTLRPELRTDLITDYPNLQTDAIHNIFHQDPIPERLPIEQLKQVINEDKFKCCKDAFSLLTFGVGGVLKLFDAALKVSSRSITDGSDRGYNKSDSTNFKAILKDAVNYDTYYNYLLSSLKDIKSVNNARRIDVCFPRVELAEDCVFSAYLKAILNNKKIKLENILLHNTSQDTSPCPINVTEQKGGTKFELRIPISWF